MKVKIELTAIYIYIFLLFFLDGSPKTHTHISRLKTSTEEKIYEGKTKAMKVKIEFTAIYVYLNPPPHIILCIHK